MHVLAPDRGRVRWLPGVGVEVVPDPEHPEALASLVVDVLRALPPTEDRWLRADTTALWRALAQVAGRLPTVYARAVE